MSVGSYEFSYRLPPLAHRMAQWSGARPNWRAAGGSNRGSGIRFFQDGFTAYPVHIRVFGPASAPSSSQFIHFLDRPTGRDPQDLSAPLDGLCAYIPGSYADPDRRLFPSATIVTARQASKGSRCSDSANFLPPSLSHPTVREL